MDSDKEFDAARRTGVIVEKLDQVSDISFVTGPGIKFPHQAQSHPLDYLKELADALAHSGGVIHGNTRVLKIEDHNDYQLVSTHDA